MWVKLWLSQEQRLFLVHKIKCFDWSASIKSTASSRCHAWCIKSLLLLSIVILLCVKCQARKCSHAN